MRSLEPSPPSGSPSPLLSGLRSGLRALVVAGALLLLVLTATPAQALIATDYNAQANRATNAQRTKYDRSTVTYSACLKRYAYAQAKRMAAKRTMYHQDLGYALRGCGLTRVSENVAFGFSDGNAVVRAWMGSTHHRANILDTRVRLTATSAVRAGNGKWYVSQLFGRR